MQTLIEYLDNFQKLPQLSKDSLLSLIDPVSCKKGDILGREKERPEHIYILESGVVRSSFTNSKGKELTRNIYVGQKLIGSLGALVLDKPSKFTFSCLLDCEIYILNFRGFKALAETDIAISNLYNKILEYTFLELESKIYRLSALNATERYLKLLQEIPVIEDLIPQYHIASLLNITPVQLSRIRGELLTK
ncbi:Crp/Fnr family transcriptional regulator [uncultured Polaribacter sp.]|uniref:Crp/Fnr family transcriptional regulator n=1 Tax=uncultured Polaribacter sp. TaxID=174711 RepID=UPI00262FD218|nr:Crp/Fnr family transcriptional regulator [uncultured Polaribacter sp.]